MRRHLKLLLTVLLVGVLMYGGDAGKCRAAEVETINGCTYDFDETTGTLTVSGEGTVGQMSNWEDYKSLVKKIVIEEGITEIGDGGVGSGAFAGCEKIESITLPDGLKKIGRSAFWGCKNLEEITIPKQVTEIEDYVFYSCESLKEITILGEVTKIGAGAFGGCESLGNIPIPPTVTEIGDYAFGGCEKIESITLPDGLKKIGRSAFAGCKNLEEITIPKQVTEIEDYVFDKCTSLREITILGEVTKIGADAFSGCESLGNIPIPPTVTEIGSCAFASCRKIESITLPDGLEKIGTEAFFDCRNLEEITIPETVTEIGDMVFWGCTGLKNIVLPDTVTEIGTLFFAGCEEIESIMLPKELRIIGSGAFSGCKNLKEITIPETVTEIGDYAFNECSSLERITISNGLTKIGDGAFSSHSASQIILPASLHDIGKGAFDAVSGKDFLIGCSNEDQIFYCQKNNYNYVDMSKPIDLSKGELTGIEKYYAYTGEAIEPEIQVTCKFSNGQTEQDIILCEGRDYEVEYSNNTECGTATVKVTGIGIYTGTLTGDFKIYKDITSYTVKLQYNEIVYDGSEKRPSITVSDDKGNPLKEGTDYDAVYQNNIHPGQATVIITGKGIYKGTTTAAYTIRGISIESAQVTLDETIFTYDGSEKKPHVTVTLQGKVLTENVDYVVSYQNNILVGTACVVIQGIGDYEGGVQMSYNILPGGDGAPAVYDKDDTLISGDLIYTITDDEEVEVAGIADKNLKKLVIPGTVDAEGKAYKVTSVGQKAFYKNNKLQSVVIGNNVASIEDYAFYGCKNVKSIKMGKSVEIIGASAFRKCTKLTSIVLPKSIDKLGKNAFYGCKKLKSITINANSVIDISANAVKGISKKAVIKVPKKLVKGYQKELKGNTGYKKTMKIKKK